MVEWRIDDGDLHFFSGKLRIGRILNREKQAGAFDRDTVYNFKWIVTFLRTNHYEKTNKADWDWWCESDDVCIRSIYGGGNYTISLDEAKHEFNAAWTQWITYTGLDKSKEIAWVTEHGLIRGYAGKMLFASITPPSESKKCSWQNPFVSNFYLPFVWNRRGKTTSVEVAKRAIQRNWEKWLDNADLGGA